MRTFGVSRFGSLADGDQRAAADYLAHAVVQRWKGAAGDELDEKTYACADALELNFEPLVQILSNVARRRLGGDPAAFFLRLLENIRGRLAADAGEEQLTARFQEAVDNVLGAADDDDVFQVPTHPSVRRALRNYANELASRQAQALRDWLIALLEAPELRVEGAQLRRATHREAAARHRQAGLATSGGLGARARQPVAVARRAGEQTAAETQSGPRQNHR